MGEITKEVEVKKMKRNEKVCGSKERRGIKKVAIDVIKKEEK